MKLFLGNLLYYPLKLWVRIACSLYFSEFKVNGLDKIPSKGPIIFAANHQNALLDALILSVISKRSPHFLTRASVFKKGIINNVLRSLKMIPIYRFRDGIGNVRKNNDSFEEAYSVLEKNNVLGIFPEGNHDLKYRIRPLQKGIARIVFQTEERNQYQKNIKIVPIGIHYEDHFNSRSRVLIIIGDPISVQDHLTEYKENERNAYDSLLNKLSKALKKLVLHISPEEKYEDLKEQLDNIRVVKKDIQAQLDNDISNLGQINLNTQKSTAIHKDEKLILITQLKNVLYKLSGLLFFLPRTIIKKQILSKVKDPHFYATAAFTSKIFIYPIYASLLVGIALALVKIL
ncbi:lysophospholipid acyltransferase family protein [Marinigracilibium pacificum]|uniref:Phospholipid/glycerol acyltransferase domain-containing protein n=1 Tax=Marinigracilibium pacificum TaxID=2729599 RepID=A0A848J6Z1_9BACT|nr:lysophospholipid acyltransferase family protein [Marinigracilibium pacificum]NMM50214.1 hypothetical protein [Marinigracilibium pacificum]